MNSTSFVNSTILTNELSTKLTSLLTANRSSDLSSIKLIFQASVDGFSAATFHSKCDGVLGTLFVAKSPNGNIFGGYTEADWSGYYQFKNDPNAFLFSLINNYNTPVKMPTSNPSMAINGYSQYGPSFGSGNEANFDYQLNFYSYGFGYSYQLPSFLTLYGTAETFLGGSNTFLPLEIEVYSLLIDRKLFY